jgi:thiol-disulfide isomerase/thioredoxin
MKQAATILIPVLIALSSFQSFAAGIDFNHNIAFQDALDRAKKEGKLVFIDCYTSWCGPCKRLAATVFTDSAVGTYFNNNYINVKFDMEKDEGPSIATRYQVTAYPTLIWLDANGSIKNKVIGGLDAASLIDAGKKAADPIPEMMAEMDKKYAAGARDEAFMEDYLKLFKSSGRDFDAVLDEYIRLAAAQHWSKETTLPVIYGLTNQYPSPGIAALTDNKSFFVSKYGAKEYSQKIDLIADDALAVAKKKTDEKMLQDAIALVKGNSADSKQQIAKMEMDYYFNTANATVYDKYVTDYIKKYAPNDAKMLNDVAWQYYINTNEEKYLKKAMQWAYKAVNISNTSATNTTYAYLQYKLGNLPEATKACDYAIIKAKEENVNPVSAQALKTEIKKEAAASK